MSEWKPDSGNIGVQPLQEANTAQQHPLGFCVTGKDYGATDYGIGVFMYVSGVASCAIGSVVTIPSDTHVIALLAANAVGPAGTAMSAIVASSYGWVQLTGKGVALVLASFADNGACYATATAGSVDDAVVAGDRVHNMVGASAIDTPSTGFAEVELNYPHTDNIAD